MKDKLENLSAKELDKLIWREQCKISLIQVKIDKYKKQLIARTNEENNTDV